MLPVKKMYDTESGSVAQAEDPTNSENRQTKKGQAEKNTKDLVRFQANPRAATPLFFLSNHFCLYCFHYSFAALTESTPCSKQLLSPD
jgi:hypothetical protein